MSSYVGRHRASRSPLPYAAASAGAVRTGAVLAATGGLVVAMAASPAQSAPAGRIDGAAPSAGPVALTAPSAGPKATSFGVIGVTAVAKPKPKPKPKPAPVVAAPAAPVATAAASRSTTTRSTTSGTTSTTSAPTKPTNPPPQAPPPPAAGGVLAIAARYLGTPYVYGGSTPAGFDCSGFTMYVFAQVGISLPRTAAGQQAAATPVSSPQPGDLVFFGYPAYHVGIYAGNGMMYDSPRTGLSVSLRSIWGGASYGRP
ncbi:MAG: C40 family peptidase [Tetrasphaera sp.]